MRLCGFRDTGLEARRRKAQGRGRRRGREEDGRKGEMAIGRSKQLERLKAGALGFHHEYPSVRLCFSTHTHSAHPRTLTPPPPPPHSHFRKVLGKSGRGLSREPGIVPSLQTFFPFVA